jgi:dTDP-4-dehydrorhamnose 3,5-epimerase
MHIIPTCLNGVLILAPKVFSDDRGFFLESYHQTRVNDLLGIKHAFVQDNHSRSVKNVLRGLHYQVNFPQGKLVRVTRGEIFDVAVDLRKNSPSFGKWAGMVLSEQNHHMAWIPPGFAHGFLVLSDVADVLYKATAFYDPASDRSLFWNDLEIGIRWPLREGAIPILSEKDRKGRLLKEADCF